MAQTTDRIQSKLYRLAYLGGIAVFFLPVLEPFLPLMFTVADSLVLGGLVRFIFGLLINRKLNQTYWAYASPNAPGSNGSSGAQGSMQEDPAQTFRHPSRMICLNPTVPFSACRPVLASAS
jgi:hypothetical protein